jgi:hypothetical protein
LSLSKRFCLKLLIAAAVTNNYLASCEFSAHSRFFPGLWGFAGAESRSCAQPETTASSSAALTPNFVSIIHGP